MCEKVNDGCVCVCEKVNEGVCEKVNEGVCEKVSEGCV